MFAKILSLIISFVIFIGDFFGFGSKLYTSKQLLADPDFASGFSVVSMDTNGSEQIKLGNFVYSNSQTVSPSWTIAQWNSKHCLWAERVESDSFTITDGVTKTVTYSPDDSSLSMRLNAANVYCGQAAGESSFPHLLIEQSPFDDYARMSDGDKLFYRCDSDRILLSLDIRLKDFKDTTNLEGINAAQFLAYFYFRGVNSNDFVWFGVNLFDSRGLQDTYWSLDTAGSNQMIYSLSTADTYGSSRKTLFRDGKPFVSDEWTHIELDLTPHIADFIKRANSSGIYGRTFSAEDFYIGGTNMGFEIHGNYDCTVDVKDYRLTSYRFM